MDKIKKAILSVISALLVISAVYMLILCIPEKKEQVEVVFLGDSIFGNYRDDTAIPAVFSEITGLSSYNAGLGGTQASNYGDGSNRSAIQNGTSLVSMVRAACYGDFTYNKASLPVLEVASLKYFPESVEGTSKVDFANAKYIVIEHGLNDYFAEREIYCEDNSLQTDVYEGALRYSVRLIKQYYPEVKIIVATPVSSDEKVSAYADVVRQIALEEKVLLFDAYELKIVTKDNIDKVTEDRVHLNEEGRKIYAGLLADFINGGMM